MQPNSIGQAITQFLTKWALPLGGWFIAEYLVHNYSVNNLLLNLLNLPMMLATAVYLYLIVRKLREQVMPEKKIRALQAWTFGVQIMFFAGLLEALFIWLFNAYLVPDNLQMVHDAMVQQLEQTQQLYKASGLNSGFLSSMLSQSADVLSEQKVASPIETAMSALSNDIFAGMIVMIPISWMVRKK